MLATGLSVIRIRRGHFVAALGVAFLGRGSLLGCGGLVRRYCLGPGYNTQGQYEGEHLKFHDHYLLFRMNLFAGSSPHGSMPRRQGMISLWDSASGASDELRCEARRFARKTGGDPGWSLPYHQCGSLEGVRRLASLCLRRGEVRGFRREEIAYGSDLVARSTGLHFHRALCPRETLSTPGVRNALVQADNRNAGLFQTRKSGFA